MGSSEARLRANIERLITLLESVELNAGDTPLRGLPAADHADLKALIAFTSTAWMMLDTFLLEGKEAVYTRQNTNEMFDTLESYYGNYLASRRAPGLAGVHGLPGNYQDREPDHRLKRGMRYLASVDPGQHKGEKPDTT